MAEHAGNPAILCDAPCPCDEVAAGADEVAASIAGVVTVVADDADDSLFQLPLESSLLVRLNRTRGLSPPSSSSVAILIDGISLTSPKYSLFAEDRTHSGPLDRDTSSPCDFLDCPQALAVSFRSCNREISNNQQTPLRLP